MRLPSPVCWLRTAWATLRTFLNSGDPTPVMGHAYLEEFNGAATVSVLKCRECGHHSIGWAPLAPRESAPIPLAETKAEAKP